MKLTKNVFTDQGGYSPMSLSGFMGSIAGFVTWGLLMTFIMATNFAPPNPGLGFLIGVGLIIPIIGIFISKNDNLIISFLGYNMITIPFGLCMGWINGSIESTVVQDAITITLLVSFMMGLFGVIFPRVFEKMGGFLFYSLIGLIIVRILQIFIPALQHLTAIDYISAGIFSLYIGYDMHRATIVSRTIENALQISISLYLDVVNLFMSILGILDKD